jgi:hypothetical protein
MQIKRKIPVFYHIPKNAGTYVSDWLLIAFRHYRTIRTNWLKNCTSNYASIKSIQLIEDGFIVARFLLGDPEYKIDCNESFKKLTKNDFSINLSNCSIGSFKQVFLFGVIIESLGFRIKNKILNLINNEITPYQFLILRDPFSIAQSVYGYNMGEESVHDYNHNKFKAKSFEDYILSSEISDSWLIRTLLNIKDSEPILEQHFIEVCSQLDGMKVYDITQVDNAIEEAILTCYQLDINTFSLKEWDYIEKNATKTKKINFESLSKKHQEVFLERTKWDKRLYEKYTRNTSYVQS